MIGSADVLPIVSLAEVQGFVRVETGDEEALLAGMVRTASAYCERFLNQVVIARPFAEVIRGDGLWQRLEVRPIKAITSVHAGDQLLASEQFSMDVDPAGAGWVRVPASLLCTVAGLAGLAGDENDVPEPIRQGVIRLTAHLYSHRDGTAGGEPPAIVTALWRPYRRLVLA
ncbi:hypothetical protein M8312_06850 [Sphingomonas sp. KRR8]|uniref:head-tail connector protein n=1 Tax=Sphingomonas sp. KRR8 TaxID=2942996 RepID=UPI0020211738|nr:hypothetical protein [Sphingomonas sp. KRR8]URD62215.1 hypothetical protein M8312_06850 [Sphingomonas sp. KRR8]